MTAKRNQWRTLWRRLDRYNKLRAELQDFDSPLEFIPRPRGMSLHRYIKLKARLRAVEAELPEVIYAAFAEVGPERNRRTDP